jgi:hypothetical protein
MEKYGIQPDAAALTRSQLPRIAAARPPLPRPPLRKAKPANGGGLIRRREDGDDDEHPGEAAN